MEKTHDMSEAVRPAKELTQRQAEILGRQFNSALTNTTAYGGAHPVTHRSCETFLAQLEKTMTSLDMLTLMLDRGSLFVEDFAVDGKFNATRLVIAFRSLGLQSITFGKDVASSDIECVMQVLSNFDDFDGLEAVKAHLEASEVNGIRVNHIVLRKFTEDDEMISREGLEDLTGLAEQGLAAGATRRSGPGSGAHDGVEQDLIERVRNVFSMRDLVAQPVRIAGQLLEATTSEDEQNRAAVVDQIRNLRSQVGQGRSDDGKPISLVAVMDALHQVRKELEETMAGQKETARFMAESGGVISEMDQLTYQTVVSIVCDEYRTGNASARRLAQIIRRVLPDARDVKRLMPLLKESLLAEGMPLGDYIAFVNELTSELKSDDLVQALEQGAESTGLTVDEIVREIRRNPDEAARLIVLASEMRQGGHGDEDHLSSALAEYIERVSGELATGESAVPTDGRAIRDSVRKKQDELVQQIRSQGVSDSVAIRIESSLAGRFGSSVADARSSRLVDLLRNSGALKDSELIDTLGRLVERESDLARLSNTMQRELTRKGYAAEKIRAIYDETVARLKRRNRLEFTPGDAMNPETSAYFLQREITTSVRYGTHFSCIMLMIARIRSQDEEWRPITPEEIGQVMPEVFEVLPLHLRDLDLLGTLGSKDRNIPLVILPMTQQEGAEKVLERILGGLEGAHLEIGDRIVGIDVLGTAICFNAEATPDSKSFVQTMRGRLANQLVSRLRS